MKVLNLTLKRHEGENLAHALYAHGHEVTVSGIMISRGNPLIKLLRIIGFVAKHRSKYEIIIVENPFWDAIAALMLTRVSNPKPKMIYYSKGFSPEVTLRGGIKRVFKKTAMKVLEKTMQEADHLVYLSTWLRERYIERSGFTGIESKPFSIIHHAPDPIFLSDDCDHIKRYFRNNPEEIRLCYAGSFRSWDKARGVSMLLKVLSLIIKDHPEQKVHLYIAGSGKLRPELEEIASNNQILEYCTFTGKLPWKELRDLYLSCDLFIYPSFQDSLSSVVMEAAVCGIPSVVTDSSGAVELVKDGITGIICDPNETSLYGAIMELILDTEKCKMMGKQANRHIRQNVSWEVSAQRFKDVLATLKSP